MCARGPFHGPNVPLTAPSTFREITVNADAESIMAFTGNPFTSISCTMSVP